MIVAASVGVMVIITADLREFLTKFFSWTLPAAIGLVIYTAAVIGLVRALKWGERLKQAPEHPSLVADKEGLVTQWSARVPWTDVQGFTTGNTEDTSVYCVLVSNVGAYPQPWWTSRTFARGEPANALPMLRHSTLGYLVRRSALGPLEPIGDDELIAELRKFRSQFAIGTGLPIPDLVQVDSSDTGERPAGRFVRLWDYAMLACFIGVLICFYLEWLALRLSLAALALVVVSFGLRTIYAGELAFKGSTLYRSRSPIMFWIGVAMILALGVGMFLGGVAEQGSTAPASVATSDRAEAARLTVKGHQSGQENRPDEAVALFTRAIQLDPASAEAYFQRAAVYAPNGRYEEARADLKRAIKLDPRHFESHRLIDWLLARQGAWDEIIAHWDRFIALEPKNAAAYLERAGAYRRKGDMQRALADIDNACGLGNQQACAIQRQTPGAGPAPRPCEAETSVLMTMKSSWPALYLAAVALPKRCFDGYFAEGISDTIVRKMGQDWAGFIAVLSLHRDDERFMALVLRSINATLDPKDIKLAAQRATSECPKALKKQCASIAATATTALRE